MKTMNMSNLKKEFSNMEIALDFIKSRADEVSAMIFLSKGPYIEFPIFSYQRNRMQQGRLIKNASKIKSYNDVYRYTFDGSNRLIREECGDELDGFCNTFYLYNSNGFLCLSYAYDDLGKPENVTSYEFIAGKLLSSRSYGRHGIMSEKYLYDGEILREIVISGRNHDEENSVDISEFFYYDDAGALHRIETKYEIGDPVVTYRRNS